MLTVIHRPWPTFATKSAMSGHDKRWPLPEAAFTLALAGVREAMRSF
jgi:hypothetical protein